MNISMIANKLDMEGGGSNFSLYLLASSLSDLGHNVRVATMNTASSNTLTNDVNFDLIEEGYEESASHVSKAQSIIRKMNELESWTDIFHIFAPPYLPAAGYFARSSTVPIVARLNTYAFFCPSMDVMDGECHKNCTIAKKFKHDDGSLSKKTSKIPLYTFQRLFQSKMSNYVDKFFALSPYVREIYSSVGLEDEKISVIPNYYNPDFGPDRMADADNHGPFHILYVGRLVKEKGVDILIDSISQLIPQNSVTDYKVSIVGDGPQKEKLVSLSRKNDIGEVVQFWDRIDHQSLGDIYQSADLFVHPARWPEPFGRTLLEAMQYSLPTVVSDIGSPQWVVGDSGITFKRNSPSSLANNISKMVTDKELYTCLKNETTQELHRFSKERVVQMVEQEYQDLLQ